MLPLCYYGLLAPAAGPFRAGLPLYITHHVLSLLSWSMMALSGQCHAIAAGLLLLEGTAPFTNGLWFMRESKLRKSHPLYLANGAMMALSFLLVRVLLMGWLGWRHFVVLRAGFFGLPGWTNASIIAGYLFGYPLQLFWFRKIVAGLFSALLGSSSKPSPKKL